MVGKFDVEGRCTEMSSVVPGSNYKDRIRVRANPVIESAGALWTYMGPAEKQPPPPGFFVNTLLEGHVVAFTYPTTCNYLQSMEGDIDSTHISTLHAGTMR